MDMFSGSKAIRTLAEVFKTVVENLDRMLESSAAQPELAALWLLSPLRLTKLYQLRCLVGLKSCGQIEQVR